MLRYNKLYIYALILSLTSCFPQQKLPKKNYEVISVEAQAIEELEGYPTTFIVDSSTDNDIWLRAKSFFTLYVEGASKNSATILHSDNNTTDQVLFKIEKKDNGDQVKYIVSCVPKTGSPISTTIADQNARNVARFLQEGKLELSLMKGLPKAFH